MSDSLEFRLLKYIVAVAETSNFTRAAERLFLAQPSLSKQIRDLEEEIKFPIFDRSRDGVRITPAGQMVLAYARETLRAREELVVMARAVHLGEVPPLRLGFSSFVNANLLQTFRDKYESMFPGCQIHLAGGEPLPINQAMNRARTKLGLDLSAWMAIVFVTVTVFLVGFRTLAIVSFPMLLGAAWLIVRKHPKMFQLSSLSLSPTSYYDPRKQ